MSAHSLASIGARHPIHNWDFADATARLAYVPVATDVGKVSHQLDSNTFWLLRNYSPVVWNSIDGSGGSSGAASLEIAAGTQHLMVGMTEELLSEFTADFAALTPITLYPKLVALTKQTGGATGTYRLRIGGTQGAVDGTILATLTTTQGAYPSTPDTVTGSSFSNPTAPRLIKVTGAASSAGQTARIRGINILFVST